MDEELILSKAEEIRRTKRKPSAKDEITLDASSKIIEHRTSILRGLEDEVAKLSGRILRGVDHEKTWQPSQYLPDFTRDTRSWTAEVRTIQDQARGLSDQLKVVLVGDTITEEALPTYQTFLNRIVATSDPTGIDEGAWGTWTREWTAEERRHGELLDLWMMLTGSFNMQEVQKDIHALISKGFDPGVGQDPYKVLIYTSFQERATEISHNGTARIARQQGNEALGKICELVAADESRHYAFYMGVMKKVFDKDPNGAMTAYAAMMKEQIRMPAERLNDEERNPALFTDFATVAQDIGVYTTRDYTNIMRRLNQAWGIEERIVSTPEAAIAQDKVLGLPDRYDAMAERRESRRAKQETKFEPSKFNWLNAS